MKLTKSMKTVFTIFMVGIIFSMVFMPYSRKEGMVKGRKELLLLHMEGCPHCVKLLPEWDNFTNMNDTNITTKSVERNDDQALVKRYGVKGFPTILLLDENGDKLKTYDGPRTAQGLLDFCHQNN
jgi:thioredoxin-related protein